MYQRLFVVEDDETHVHLFKRYLRRSEWSPEVIYFEYGSDAIDFFADEEVAPDDIVLLDLNLPDTSGIQVLAHLRQKPNTATIRVVVLTTSDSESERERCVALGVDHFLEKPFSYDTLLTLMSQLNVEVS